MQLANLGLAAAASVSLLIGAVYQGQAKPQSLPLSLFAQAQPEHFIGDKACAECHEDQVANFHKSGHATFMNKPGLPIDRQGCEACHGPGKFHLDEDNPRNIAYSKLAPKEISDACLRCHGDVMKQSHWHRTEHAKANVSCTSCHQIHPGQPNDAKMGDRGLVKREVYPTAKSGGKLLKADEPTLCGQCHQSEIAQFRQNSHHPIPEGRVTCSDCHTVHPTKASKGQVEIGKQKCVKCHADVAGPFVFEHDPVAGWTGEGCNECHKPHGSQNPKLLKGFSRGLCSQCHTDKGTTHFPGRTCWQAGCHVAVHGSNTSRRLFQR